MSLPQSRHHLLFLSLVFIGIVIAGSKHVHASSVTMASAVFISAVVPTSLRSGLGAGKQASSIEIGGQPVVHLTRKPSHEEDKPEFLSATILPGRGMNLFQITAKLPGKGVVDILASPSLEEAASTLDGGPKDSHGIQSFAFGGAFLAPYANRIRGKLTPDGKSITTQWQGKPLTLPAVWKGKANQNAELHAIHGLILDRKTNDLKVQDTKDGQTVTGFIHSGSFDRQWFSSTDLTITIKLTGETVEASITAKNVGNKPEPIGIGWHPYFAIPSGDRKQVRLHIPGSNLAEVNNYDDVFPTGKLLPVRGTKYDFTAPEGKPLESIFLDDNFSQLVRKDKSVVVDLVDPAAGYGLHIRGLSGEIKTIQVYAPPAKPYVAIEEQFNFADPFSPVWGKLDTGMVTLAPGKSVNWTVSLELFTPAR
jgi:aldose 1-epimerase